MENASKALMIAGSILIALVIIAALKFMFSGINNYYKGSEENKEERQIADFNKEFTSFEKKLYGSELLSLINKAVDYNTQNEQEGFKKISIKVTVKNGTGNNSSSSLVKSGTYTIDKKDSNVVSVNLLNEIEIIKTKYGGDKYLQRLVSLKDSGKRDEIDTLLKEINTSYTYNNFTAADIQKYAEYIEFKRKQFEFVKTLFDGEQSGASINNSNGRIVQMEYKEIT